MAKAKGVFNSRKKETAMLVQEANMAPVLHKSIFSQLPLKSVAIPAASSKWVPLLHSHVKKNAFLNRELDSLLEEYVQSIWQEGYSRGIKDGQELALQPDITAPFTAQ